MLHSVTPKDHAPAFIFRRNAQPVWAKAVLAANDKPWLWFPSKGMAAQKCLGNAKALACVNLKYAHVPEKLGWYFSEA